LFKQRFFDKYLGEKTFENTRKITTALREIAKELGCT